ncbi:ATP-binding protein [Mycoplasmopsis arginini]|uniref:DNA binding domain-containing protein n=1 Tax=Mycoplasmopsis arginini TaxID=2094 RepID=A0AA43R055_MYCAR|nr:ATP-binding protein [Mycoplasmopsis arginini]MCY2903030.1 putative DNA binding domain-containing protein [Mycoplasmopsis arginini QMP CG1-2758]MDI3349740.1 putative DNA binding domain-containing protein [Mycoplasmopsis arginini]MDI3350392.1 putative DNA binding domain-containing protein [Mycoplasmopsis arginini]MDI3350785.1 putative DNA binding domain-containing protein [Mycoplasmopsis arginini]MDI3351452.1 putative DNA binding domain-containing protein [Mycoplasmopsis arginini]
MHNRLFCTRWNGLTKTGLDEARDDREIEGSIVNQLIRALDFFEANTHKRWHKESTGRVEEPDYDMLAIQEALVNAIIHRDYTELGSEVCLDIYDDRIEISSPGIAYDNQNIPKNVDFIVKSKRRNPILADVFSRMHYMDRRGSGLKKITDETRRLFNDEGYHVEYYNNNGFFMVTIYNANYGKNGNVTENVTNVTKNLTNLENQVLELIKQGINTTKDLVVKTGKTKMSISRTTASLQQKHLILRVGSSRIGHWEVKD